MEDDVAVAQGVDHSIAEQMLETALFEAFPAMMQIHDTAVRVMKTWREMTAGYEQHPAVILEKRFDCPDVDQLIVCAGISFTSLCEHHLMPFAGSATVGYLPSKSKVVGLSKLARLVDCFAMRLQIQERMTREIAEALTEELDPLAVGVVVNATHSCLACRGPKKPGATMITSCMLGLLRDNAALRQEFMALTR